MLIVINYRSVVVRQEEVREAVRGTSYDGNRREGTVVPVMSVLRNDR